MALSIMRMVDTDEPMDSGDAIDDLVTLSELIIVLDGWIRHGGYLPKRWQR